MCQCKWFRHYDIKLSMYRSLVLAWPLPLFSELFINFAEFLDGFPKIDTDFSMFLGVVYMWRPTPGDLTLQQVKHLYLQYLKKIRIRVTASHIVVSSSHDLIWHLSASRCQHWICVYGCILIEGYLHHPQPPSLNMDKAYVWLRPLCWRSKIQHWQNPLIWVSRRLDFGP